MPHDFTTLCGAVEAWVERGWLRDLERAFLHFLRELDPEGDPLCLLAAIFASHQLGRGHVCLDLQALCVTPEDVLGWPPASGGDAPLPMLPSALLAGCQPKALSTALLKSPLARKEATNTPLVVEDQRLYLRRFWQYEQQVARAIQARLRMTAELPADLKTRLDALFPATAQSSAPDWQKIACALAARGYFTLITGGPGTGKTSTVVRVLAVLQSLARDGGTRLRIRLAAPTGKAAARLTESIGRELAKLPAPWQVDIPTEATTLHRLLGARPETRHFHHHAAQPVHADLVVVDEASMIDLETMAALLDALRPHTRLVLLGDKDQLASVEAGAVLGDLCRDADRIGYGPEILTWLGKATGQTLAGGKPAPSALAQHTVLLTTSHRFHADSGIGQLARAINQGDAAAVEQLFTPSRALSDISRIALKGRDDPALAHMALDGGRAYFGQAALASSELPQGYREYLRVIHDQRPAAEAGDAAHTTWMEAVLDAFDQFRVLAALRSGDWGVEGLNARIAESLHHERLIPQTHGWYEGRPVLVTRNDYDLGLMNGDIGIALRLPEPATADMPTSGGSRLRVVFRQADQSLKAVLPSRLVDVQTAYAMTVHKSQGSEFTHVALVLPDRPNPILTRELLYTGVTRAKRWFSLWLPEAGVLPTAIQKQVRRYGGLTQALAALSEDEACTASSPASFSQ